MDALSRLLMLNAPQGTIDKNCVLGSDWQLPHGAGELSVIRWHALTQGAAKLEMPTGEIFTLRPGNVVLLPQNSAHRLSHVDNESTCIVCGTLRLQHSARYFLTSLPETLFVAPVNHSVEYNWLREAIPFLQQESRSAMPGVDALCSQICATFFTLAVREWIAQVNTEKNILSLLLHPRLGAVIQQMMEMPGHAWTVESLASIAHMSLIFPTIRSLGLLWMKSCIWHSRSWIMHCFLLREHRSQKHFWKQESEKISADLMTAAPISRFSRSWQRMRMKSRRQNL